MYVNYEFYDKIRKDHVLMELTTLKQMIEVFLQNTTPLLKIYSSVKTYKEPFNSLSDRVTKK
jgi:hypothetical protein